MCAVMHSVWQLLKSAPKQAAMVSDNGDIRVGKTAM